eukprot:6830411-Prymnesium_polylepis.1
MPRECASSALSSASSPTSWGELAHLSRSVASCVGKRVDEMSVSLGPRAEVRGWWGILRETRVATCWSGEGIWVIITRPSGREAPNGFVEITVGIQGGCR